MLTMNEELALKKEDFLSSKYCGLKRKYNIKDFETIFNIINNLEGLTIRDKNLILIRFKRISKFISKNYRSVYKYYNVSKIFIITAGIITPALMSINGSNSNHDGFESTLFLFIWFLQIMISIVTSYVSFYKWDKKYFLYMAYHNQIEQEIWLYLELSSRYGIINKRNRIEKQSKKVTHQSKLPLFLNRIEYLYKKLKESDYEIELTDDEKHNEKNKHHNEEEISPSFYKSTMVSSTPYDTRSNSLIRSTAMPPKQNISYKITKIHDKNIESEINKKTEEIFSIIDQIIIFQTDYNKFEKDLETNNNKNSQKNIEQIKLSIETILNQFKICINEYKNLRLQHTKIANDILNYYWSKYENSPIELKNKYKKILCDNLEILELPIISTNITEV